MKAISLYWFAAQQQTTTFKWQKIGLFHAKYNVDFNELNLFF